ncbi:LacI family DNA-binding transcriptional regulator [Mangrovibacterium marinum]|uniref:LacI family transcriptional regulator n=1 Tax=Mangrovibacterium marinum TaxID=1639118 RepID=A0A2T5BY17_9BACT|nr:LacI family DNA-binding transcriptional regulator [Mangrovibacterium marinum]PTN06283.1 LacI family transcriptional regulator [Mangrovibacterium marinum]
MAKKSIARIKDIAERAKVSTGTVDRVLHNRGRVSEDVKQRVLAIVKELNYEPNILAQALKSSRKFTLAALTPDPKADEYWEAPMQGIEQAEHDHRQFGLEVKIHTFNPADQNSFKDTISKIDKNSYDGILLAPIFGTESLSYMSEWKSAGIPFCLFNTHIPDYEPLTYIGQDSYQSGILAAKLLHYGHPAPTTFVVAHVDEDLKNSPHLIRKEIGFTDYFQQANLSDFNIVKLELNDRNNKAAFYGQLERFLAEHPDTSGIFVTNSRAFHIAAFLEEKQLGHIRLIGYDLLPQNIDYLNADRINFIINQNPFSQGYFGIKTLADFLIFKIKPAAIKYLPLDLITKENLRYYLNSSSSVADILSIQH